MWPFKKKQNQIDTSDFIDENGLKWEAANKEYLRQAKQKHQDLLQEYFKEDQKQEVFERLNLHKKIIKENNFLIINKYENETWRHDKIIAIDKIMMISIDRWGDGPRIEPKLFINHFPRRIKTMGMYEEPLTKPIQSSPDSIIIQGSGLSVEIFIHRNVSNEAFGYINSLLK